ncbi:hypothetical protein N7U66_09555 [Lacinutrix neustonica]|uniref:Uncharacterized protein n=1 Tax=Lacinutrix neustonica TaxID=2980107 RepID=A0A9E8SEX1_9FLAO|nr:hypothetical protein [Lacinutrix neustonica]WAC03666.1 hypothetical protein N7U66_09555 [Lacinutrix neustonica]
MLENTNNIIGIKALINGKGFDFKGKIVDSKNAEVVSFKNEYLGMSKCSFYYKASERYEAIFDINDTTYRVKLQKAKRLGLVLKVINSQERKDVLSIELQTNSYSINNTENNYTLLFHQKNKLSGYTEISLKDTMKLKLELQKEGLFNGVNSVTVFKNKQPVLERKFFNYKEDEKLKITCSELKTQKDSLVYKLSLNKIGEKANLSVSVFSETAGYNQINTIESAFLLTPYVKGYVENPQYYFNSTNKTANEDLDLLLLTQGWTQYSTEEYLKQLNPDYKYNFELGFNLEGRVSPVMSNRLALISKKNQLIVETFLKNDTKFSFKKLLIYEGDSIKVAFLGGENGNKAIKPRNIYFDTVVKRKNVLSRKFHSDFIKSEDKKIELLAEDNYRGLNVSNITELGEVKLKGKKEASSI